MLVSSAKKGVLSAAIICCNYLLQLSVLNWKLSVAKQVVNSLRLSNTKQENIFCEVGS